MNLNTRDGQRRVASALMRKLGKHSMVGQVKHMRKLQCRLVINALLAGQKIEVCKNGDVKVRIR